MCTVKDVLLLTLATLNKGHHLILILLLLFSHRGFQNFVKSQNFHLAWTKTGPGFPGVFQTDLTSHPAWKLP